ncbi:RNA-processing protein [Candidatus Woesearchaeota archaeon]|nr:RNA-processing protein [Candidatus Woesearchaeota archaeon]
MTSEQYSYDLRMPKERVAVLIGKAGSVKRELEVYTHTKILVDSKEGDVLITGEDALSLFSAREIIKAIARGFNPDIAKLLFNQSYLFESINIKDYAKTKNEELRLKGRIIGQEGKSRRVIEELTECYLCVYGKTISMIGEIEKLPLVRRALEMLLSGSPHSTVFHWLERQRGRQKRLDTFDNKISS